MWHIGANLLGARSSSLIIVTSLSADKDDERLKKVLI